MTHQTSIKEINIPGLSYTRILSCFAIVLLHSLFASTVYYGDAMSGADRTAEMAVEHMLMWAVPCFLMVTGALQLDPERTLTTGKLIGYIRRAALALVIFTFLFQVLDYLQGEETTVITGWIRNLFMGRSWPHMWYLYLLIGLYLMLPFYKMITERASERQILYLIILLIVFVSIIPMLQSAGVECGFYIPTGIIYPVYLFMGFLLHRKKLPVEYGIGIFAVCSAVILTLTLFGSEETSALFSDYASVTVIGQSAGMFIIMDHMTKPLGRFAAGLDRCTFGIYLIHMIGVKAVMKWVGFDPYAGSAIVNFAVMSILFFAGAYAVTLAIRKIPGNKVL